jgi:hypothetical protein
MAFLKRLGPRMDERKFAAAFHATYRMRFNKKELENLFSEEYRK